MIVGYWTSLPILVTTGTIYPAYATYKAVAAKEAEAMTRWLQYWICYAIFMVFESMLDTVGAFVPFFYEAKVAFFLWLVADKFQGATFLFKKYLEPLMGQYESVIDEQIDFAVARVKTLKVEDMRAAVDFIKTKGGAIAGAPATAAPFPVNAAPEQKDVPEEVEVVEAEEKKEK